MDQDDIYNLLLLLLLMSNERSNCDCENSCGNTRGSINELILASMLLNSCNSRDNSVSAQNDNNGGCGRRRNGNTTF